MQQSLRKKICEREPEVRNKDFDEVVLGYCEEDAVAEASRCINCKNPRCKAGCPVGIDIPDFLQAIIKRDFLQAFKIIKSKNSLPCITGRVCPQETQCEGACILGIKGESVAIGNLERFIGDWANKPGIVLENESKFKTETEFETKNELHTKDEINAEKWILNKIDYRRKVAIIGSGPAGLACAGECAKMGFDTTVFEALHAVGGVLRFGIPKFRLPSEVLEKEVEYLKLLGVKFELNSAIGYTLTFQDLKDAGFEAFFIASGAGIPYFLNIPNENLKNIYSANEFLTRINLMNAYLFPRYDTPINLGKKAIVIGGGNVAMDSARILVRLGLDEVVVVYRRTKEEMPARKAEVLHAEEEGVKFCLLKQSLEFLDDRNGSIRGLKLQNMKLVDDVDGKGRKQVEEIEGEFTEIEADIAVIAIGQNANPMIAEKFGLELNHHKHIVVDKDTMETSIKGVFAGGDITTGAATVISAMGAGKKAANAIAEYLKKLK